MKKSIVPIVGSTAILALIYVIARVLLPPAIISRPPIIIKGTPLLVELDPQWGDSGLQKDGEANYVYKLVTSTKKSATLVVRTFPNSTTPYDKSYPDVASAEFSLKVKDAKADAFTVTILSDRVQFSSSKALNEEDTTRPKTWAHAGYGGSYFRIITVKLRYTNDRTQIIPLDRTNMYSFAMIVDY